MKTVPVLKKGQGWEPIHKKYKANKKSFEEIGSRV